MCGLKAPEKANQVDLEWSWQVISLDFHFCQVTDGVDDDLTHLHIKQGFTFCGIE